MIDYRIITSRRIDIRGDYDGNSVGAPSESYLEQAQDWWLIDDLMGGTMVMRSRGETWLPREPNETPQSFKIRLQRSFLVGFFKDAVETVVAKPFSRSVVVKDEENLPEQLQDLSKNVDRQGQDLTELGRTCMESMAVYGRAHVFVDYPNTGGTLNLAQERQSKVRPLLKFVHPHDLIGWRGELDAAGEYQFTQVRIREYRKEPKGKYGDTDAEYVRVYNAPSPNQVRATQDAAGQATSSTQVTWELYKRQDNGSYLQEGSTGTLTIGKIPLVTCYSKRCGWMKSEPPMRDLAELNLCHWQSSSDQRNCLRFSRIGMIAMTGVSQDEMDKKTNIAPNATLKSTNPNAKFYYVEASGGAIQAGERDIVHIEEQMEVLGMAPFVARTSASTATGKLIDTGKVECSVQMWAHALEAMLEDAYKLAADWIKQEIPADFAIVIFTDFAVIVTGSTDGALLLTARQSRELSGKTFLNEWKRRGILADGLDVDDELDEIEAEGPTFDQQLQQQVTQAKVGAIADGGVGTDGPPGNAGSGASAGAGGD